MRQYRESKLCENEEQKSTAMPLDRETTYLRRVYDGGGVIDDDHMLVLVYGNVSQIIMVMKGDYLKKKYRQQFRWNNTWKT